MATSYTSLLGLALPVTGELQGTWGDTVNNSITSLLDTAVAGTTALSTDGDVTLTTTTGASNQARQAILLCTGARTAQRTITAPAQSKIYTVINATTGGFAVRIVGAGPTTGITVAAGESALIAWNGSDFIKISNTGGAGTFTNLTVTGNLTVNSLTNTRVPYASTSGLLVDSANMTFNGTRLTVADLADSGLTATRVVYSTTGGALVDSANLTFDGTNLTLGGGTANGVAYLNGSKVLTTGSALTFDGTTLTGTSATSAANLVLNNTSGATQTYVNFTSGATVINAINRPNATNDFRFDANYGSIVWGIGSAGTASEQMRLTSTGLGIGTSSPTQKLTVNGNAAVGGQQAFWYRDDDGFSGSASRRAWATTANYDVLGALSFKVSTAAGGNPLSGTTAMMLDSVGNLGLGVTPSAWQVAAGRRAIEVGSAGNGLYGFSAANFNMSSGAYYDGAWRYSASGTPVSYYNQSIGAHSWFTAPSGTAGNAISFTQAMTLAADGNLLVGTTTSSGTSGRLHVAGTAVGGEVSARIENLDSSNAVSETGLRFMFNGTLKGYVGTIYGSGGASTMYFYNNGAERARIDSSGNFGIGTSSPGFKLDVAGTGNFQGLQTSGSPSLSFGASKWMTQQESNVARTYYCGPNASTYQSWEIYRATSTGSQSLTASFDLNGNLGLGVTPSAWGTSFSQKAFQFGPVGSLSSLYASSANPQTNLSCNAWEFTASPKYITDGPANAYRQLAGYHAWFTAPSGTAGNAISFTQAMTLDASGNLGVGTTSPAGRLDVVGTADQIRAGNGTVTSFLGGSGSNGYTGTLTNHSFLFYTNSTERARITSSGNFGIGTSTPAQRLHAYGNIEFGGTSTPFLYSHRNAVISGAVSLGNIEFAGDTSTTALCLSASIRAFSDGAWTDSSFPSNLRFLTTSSGSTTPVERARIDSNGKLTQNAGNYVATTYNESAGSSYTITIPSSYGTFELIIYAYRVDGGSYGTRYQVYHVGSMSGYPYSAWAPITNLVSNMERSQTGAGPTISISTGVFGAINVTVSGTGSLGSGWSLRQLNQGPGY